MSRLVVDDSDDTGGASTELILGSAVGNATSPERTDISSSLIRPTLDLIQRSVVVVVERTCGAVSSNTWRATVAVDVTRGSAHEGGCRGSKAGVGNLGSGRHLEPFIYRRRQRVICVVKLGRPNCALLGADWGAVFILRFFFSFAPTRVVTDLNTTGLLNTGQVIMLWLTMQVRNRFTWKSLEWLGQEADRRRLHLPGICPRRVTGSPHHRK